MNKLPPKDDENPEWTDEDFKAAKLASTVLKARAASALVKKRGRPPMAAADRKQKVNIRLSPDVLAALRSTGVGWQTRADELLRKGLKIED